MKPQSKNIMLQYGKKISAKRMNDHARVDMLASGLMRISVTMNTGNSASTAHQAMRGYKGTMVLIDPDSGEILAAYGTPGYHPFTRLFQPGRKSHDAVFRIHATGRDHGA